MRKGKQRVGVPPPQDLKPPIYGSGLDRTQDGYDHSSDDSEIDKPADAPKKKKKHEAEEEARKREKELKQMRKRIRDQFPTRDAVEKNFDDYSQNCSKDCILVGAESSCEL